MTSVVVVETSYLCELYRVPGFSDKNFSARVRQKWNWMAHEESASFFVPLGCIYQLCDHIADVPDGNRRRQLATLVVADVESSLESGNRWNILPTQGLDDLPGFLRRFAADPTHLRLGLTNSEVLQMASDLKNKYGGKGNFRVHIWTRNQTLKAYEPDAEPDPLI